MSDIVVLTDSQLKRIIEDTWQQSREATELILKERWIGVPEAAMILDEHQSGVNKKVAAGVFKNVRPKGQRFELLYSEVFQISKKGKNGSKVKTS